MNNNIVVKLAEQEAARLKENGWSADILKYRQIYKELPNNERKKFKEIVEEKLKS